MGTTVTGDEITAHATPKGLLERLAAGKDDEGTWCCPVCAFPLQYDEEFDQWWCPNANGYGSRTPVDTEQMDRCPTAPESSH